MKKMIPLLLCILLLAACDHSPGPAASTPPQAPLENIFTNPPTTPQETGPSAPGITTSGSRVDPQNIGSSSFGILRNDLSFDAKGKYVLYEGGQLHIHLKFSFDGTIANEGVGVLVLLDGIPQPYKTADSEEYAYLHTFYPPTENGGEMVPEISFVPITGKAGDTLTLTFQCIYEPDFSPTWSVNTPSRYTNGAQFYETPLVMNADPPECPVPAVTERITSLTVTEEALSSKDTRGWTAEDLATKASFSYGFPTGQRSSYIFQKGEDATLDLHAEVFSPGFIHWRLVVYMDNQPVSVLTENDIGFSVPNGKKIVIDMALSMAGTDGEMPLYMILVNRSAHTPESWNTECHTETTLTHYLLEFEDLDAWMALRGAG